MKDAIKVNADGKIADKIVDSITMEVKKDKDFDSVIKGFQDAKDTQKGLKIKVHVTSGNYVNENYRFYRAEDLKKAAKTFYQPFPKPVHDGHPMFDETPVLGRIESAKYEEITDAKKGGPTCRIVAEAIISDQSAIDKIKDGRFLTVSSGAHWVDVPTCSICGLEVNDDACTHYKGHKYEDKLCYWISNGLAYDEFSFVSSPADQSKSHYAGVISASVVDLPDNFKINQEISDTSATTKIVDSKEVEPKVEDKIEEKPAVTATIPTVDANAPIVDAVIEPTEAEKKAKALEDAKKLIAAEAEAKKILDQKKAEDEAKKTFDEIEKEILADEKNKVKGLLDKKNKEIADATAEAKRLFDDLEAQKSLTKEAKSEREVQKTLLLEAQIKNKEILSAFSVLNDAYRKNLAENVVILEKSINKELNEAISKASNKDEENKIIADKVESYLSESTNTLMDKLNMFKKAQPVRIEVANVVDKAQTKAVPAKAKSKMSQMLGSI
jgi:hypothetical protein